MARSAIIRDQGQLDSEGHPGSLDDAYDAGAGSTSISDHDEPGLRRDPGITLIDVGFEGGPQAYLTSLLQTSKGVSATPTSRDRTDSSPNVESRKRNHEETDSPKRDLNRNDASRSTVLVMPLDRENPQNTRRLKRARLEGGKVKNQQEFQSHVATERSWESGVFLQMRKLAPVVDGSYNQRSPVYHDRSVPRVEEYYSGLRPYTDHLQNHRRKVSDYLGEE